MVQKAPEETIKSVFGMTDELRKFYAEIETGKFAEEQLVGNSEQLVDAPVFKLDPERALNTLKDFDDVLNGRKPKVEIAQITPELAKRIYTETGIKITPNSGVDLDRAGAVHTVSTHGQGGKKTAMPLTNTDLAALPITIEQADVIKRGYAKRGTDRIVFEKEIGHNRKAVTEVIKKGNTLKVVTYFNDSSSGRTDAAHDVSSLNDTSETGQLQSTNRIDSLTQADENVKLSQTPVNDQLADNYIQHQLKEQNQQRKANWRDKLRDIRAKFTHHLVDDAVAYDL